MRQATGFTNDGFIPGSHGDNPSEPLHGPVRPVSILRSGQGFLDPDASVDGTAPEVFKALRIRMYRISEVVL
jgi:hypothetical protein